MLTSSAWSACSLTIIIVFIVEPKRNIELLSASELKYQQCLYTKFLYFQIKYNNIIN